MVLAKTSLDLKDAAILEYIRHFCEGDSARIKRKEIKEGERVHIYVWINYRHMAKEMPLLKIKSTSSISRRVEKIRQARFIKIYKAQDNSIYIRLAERIKELEFSNLGLRYVYKDRLLLKSNRGCCSKAIAQTKD